MKALLSGRSIDRVPVCPFDGSCGAPGFCAKNVGYPAVSIQNDPGKSFWAQIWTQEQYGLDGIPNFGYGSYGGWEFGGEIKSGGDQYSQGLTISRYPVESEEEIATLKLPDVRTAGILPLAMEFSRLQMEHGLPVTPFWASPFTCAGNLVGLSKLSRWVKKKPESVHRLLRLCTDHILQVAKYWVDTFAPERIIARDILPMEANQIISPKQFETFALPYLIEVHEKVLSMGVKHFNSHICGDQNLNLPYLAQIPMGDPGIVSFGHEVDLDAAIKYFGMTCIIEGNVNPITIMTGSAREVYDLCKQSIEKGMRAPRGYILTAGCEIPPPTPPYNLYVMVKAAKDFRGHKD